VLLLLLPLLLLLLLLLVDKVASPSSCMEQGRASTCCVMCCCYQVQLPRHHARYMLQAAADSVDGARLLQGVVRPWQQHKASE
jgi:hypothetical protein